MQIKNKYTPEFYRNMNTASVDSVDIILAILFNVVSKPSSVVDVGAGVGSWVKGLADRGCDPVVAVEGNWVKNAKLQVPVSFYHFHDLKHPLRLGQRFDLAVSLEVAEHLPESRGPSFVEDLTLLSDVVLFSAAIPGQGGTDHINEQWQQYWVDMFAAKGYQCFDPIRPVVWNDGRVRFEYRQNMLLFVAEQSIGKVNLAPTQPLIASVIHPHIARMWGPGIRVALQFLVKALARRLQR